MVEPVTVEQVCFGEGAKPAIIAGLCIIEDRETTIEVAECLSLACRKQEFPFVFKASFDKANRSSVESYRGPGMDKGLEILSTVREKIDGPVLTDIHDCGQAQAAAQVVDILQIPAFLCRQTDLLVSAAKTGKAINIKKGQFMAPWDLTHAADKVRQTGNDRILLTERGTSFGYNNLVADLRSLSFMQQIGYPVIMDVTHSLQMPGGLGHSSGGYSEFVPNLARAAVAWGCDGLFLEVHPEPERALSDGPNSLRLDLFEGLLSQIGALSEALGAVRKNGD